MIALTRARHVAAVLLLTTLAACQQQGPSGTYEWPTGEAARLDGRLAPGATAPQRDGLAAAILIDVSGSMSSRPRRGSEPKIVSARRAALDLVDQFVRYAADHPDEPVMLGLYEFSDRSGVPSARAVIPMGTPDRARAAEAVARMQPRGDTPIGEALIEGKRALDATGLIRRHLLVITDGLNTEGVEPEEVVAAINKRPEIERPAMYFVAFDVEAKQFAAVKEAGTLVLEAANSQGLNETLDMLLRGEILLEK
jgi:Mg-chelatase subunit ChlD